MSSSDPLNSFPLPLHLKQDLQPGFLRLSTVLGLVNLSHALHCGEQRGVVSLNALNASRASIRLILPSLPLPRLCQSRLSLDFATGALGSRLIPS